MGLAIFIIVSIYNGIGGGTDIDVEEGVSLPFFDITNFPGVSELEKVIDSTSEAIKIPNGLIFGNEVVSSVYVS